MLKINRGVLVGIIAAVIIGVFFAAEGCVFAEKVKEKDSTVFEYPQAKLTKAGLSFYKAAESTEDYPAIKGKARNVIFLIGDGMGPNQVRLARLKGAGAEGRLYMEKLPVKGQVMTSNVDGKVTDSAAAGTALACGVKTKNGMIGIGADGAEYQTILEAAKEKGKRTGLVVTSRINHATPATFASHVKSRNTYPEIAKQLAANKVNVMLGGGKKYYSGKNEAKVVGMGYKIITTKEELESANGEYVLGLFAKEDLTTTKADEPRLWQMTEKALELLNKEPAGFFVMVEGSQIDFAGHGNNADEMVRQVLEFDLAVKEAIEFAIKDGQTLVVVTADHETGGLKISQRDNGEVKVDWSTRGHSAVNVPLFAFGPGAEMFGGVMDNTEVPIKMAEIVGLNKLPKRQ